MGLFNFLDPIGIFGGGGGGGQGGIGNDSQVTNATQTDQSHTQGNDSIYNAGTITTYSMDGDVAMSAMDTASILGGTSLAAATQLGQAIAGASTDLAKMAFESAQNLARLSYDESQSAREAGTVAQQSASSLAANMAGMVAESKKDPNNATLENVFKWGGLGLAAIAIAWIISRTFAGRPAAKPSRKGKK